MHEVAVETHIYLLTGKVHVGILHLRVTIQMSRSTYGIVCQRVISRILHRGIDTVLSFFVDAVECERVVNGLVVLIYRQLERVHLSGVTLHLDCRSGSFGNRRGIGRCILFLRCYYGIGRRNV